MSDAPVFWSQGDYDAVAAHLAPASEALVQAVEEEIGSLAGRTVLDVGAGSGNTSIAAAQRGAHVVSVDISPAQLDLARRRIEGQDDLDIDLRVGDAQALDLPDAAFDAVVSVFGLIFAPDAAAAARETARVCRPGGLVAFTAWTEGGWMSAWRDRAQSILPPAPGAPSPDTWAEPGVAAARLRAAGLEPRVERRTFSFDFPGRNDVFGFYAEKVPSLVVFLQRADAEGKGDEARAALREVIDKVGAEHDGAFSIAAPYLLVSARKPA